uniref:Vascular protein 9 n=1 Tax=Plantago major TaxID=29818 RepID=Q1EML6_PLAMJ|nr:vascular protein 9 [Plantago major]
MKSFMVLENHGTWSELHLCSLHTQLVCSANLQKRA